MSLSLSLKSENMLESQEYDPLIDRPLTRIIKVSVYLNFSKKLYYIYIIKLNLFYFNCIY